MRSQRVLPSRKTSRATTRLLVPSALVLAVAGGVLVASSSSPQAEPALMMPISLPAPEASQAASALTPLADAFESVAAQAAHERELVRLEAERIERERLEAERIERERVEAERIERERVEAERVEAQARRAEAERVERERAAEAERVKAAKAARDAEAAPKSAPAPKAPKSAPAAEPATGGGGAGGAFAALRKCESGGNYATNTGNGYYGAYQFSASTWRGLGFSGLPHQASPGTQDEAAAKLQARSGWGQWPACARKLGLL